MRQIKLALKNNQLHTKFNTDHILQTYQKHNAFRIIPTQCHLKQSHSIENSHGSVSIQLNYSLNQANT